MRQLGLWSRHPPCSQRSVRCLLMEAQTARRSQHSDPLTIPAEVSAKCQTMPQASVPSQQRPQTSWNSTLPTVPNPKSQPTESGSIKKWLCYAARFWDNVLCSSGRGNTAHPHFSETSLSSNNKLYFCYVAVVASVTSTLKHLMENRSWPAV